MGILFHLVIWEWKQTWHGSWHWQLSSHLIMWCHFTCRTTIMLTGWTFLTLELVYLGMAELKYTSLEEIEKVCPDLEHCCYVTVAIVTVLIAHPRSTQTFAMASALASRRVSRTENTSFFNFYTWFMTIVNVSKMLQLQTWDGQSSKLNCMPNINWLTFHTFTPLSFSLEINASITEVRNAWANVDKWAKPEKPPFSIMGTPMRRVIYKEPKGVVMIISPFNFPMWLTFSPLVRF